MLPKKPSQSAPKTTLRFVIYAKPSRGTWLTYIDKDGKPTIKKSKAAKFSSMANAVAFAAEKKIALNEQTFIEQTEFSR